VRTLGIDIGLNGALAVVDGDRLIDVHDMPTFSMERNGKNKRMVNAAELARLIKQAAPASAYLERLNAMPGQGVTSMFSMGQSLGKDGSRYRAAQLFPAHAAQFARVKDDGRSDAVLIAAYGASR
jgi:crossover junction endodeoxyribonuclease RuvC